MISAKEQMIHIIHNQPEDSSYDEILKELAFHRMIEKGLSDSDHGRTISNEEMGRRIRKWSNWIGLLNLKDGLEISLIIFDKTW